MTPEQKDIIDSMDYKSLLRLWRYAPTGNPLFKGDTGFYYEKVMTEKGEQIGHAARVSASKSITAEAIERKNKYASKTNI